MVLTKFDKLKQKLADTTEVYVQAQGTKVVFSVNFPGGPDADKFVQELTETKEEKKEAPAENPEEKPEEEGK